mgnify:CR=1 FL=1
MINSWQFTTIDKITENLDNQRIPISKMKRNSGAIPYYGATGIVDYVDGYIFNEELLLIGEDGADWSAGANTSFIINGKSWVNNHVHVLRTVNANIKFLMNYLNYADLREYVSGTTRGKLNKASLMKIRIPNPPIKIQQKIANTLSSIDEAIQKTEQIIQKTEVLKRGLMQNVLNFGNKDNVRYLTLGDIGKVSMCKRIFKSETSDTGDIPFYKIGTFGKDPDSYISKELYDRYRDKYPFPKIGDVLLSASGTIGRKVKYDGRPAYFQDSNIVWLEHDESKILNDFLFYLYDTITWQTEGSTIKRLYNEILLRKVIPVPSIEKQNQILEVLSVVDEKISVNKRLKDKLILLKNGIMQDIFNQRVQIN